MFVKNRKILLFDQLFVSWESNDRKHSNNDKKLCVVALLDSFDANKGDS